MRVVLDGDPREANQATTPRKLTTLDQFEGTLANRVYLSLRKAIVGLDYAPGEKLRKIEICEALNVSRSPVSAAIARLAVDRLVDVYPQAGTYVSRLSVNEIREGAFIREALELAAIDRVVPHITDDQIAQLRRNLRLQEAMVTDGDQVGFFEHDARMHELVMSFTGYRRLHVIAESAQSQVDRARQLMLPAPGRIIEAFREHEAIVSAIEDRDPKRARDAMHHHLGQLVTMVALIAKNQPALFHSDN